MIAFLLLAVGFLGMAFLAFPFVRERSMILQGLCIASGVCCLISLLIPVYEWWLK